MKPSSPLLCLVLIFLSLLSFSGCWDQKELESLALVQILGLDLSDDGRELLVSTMIAIPSKLGVTGEGGGGGEGPGVTTLSIQAPSIYEAFNRINTTLNREVTLLQNQVLLIGEALAKKGIGPWIDNLLRFPEMRRTLLIFICQGKATELFKVEPPLENNPAEYLRDLILLSKYSGMFPLTTIHDFIKRYESYAQQNYGPILAPYHGESAAKTDGSKPEQPTAGENPGQSEPKPPAPPKGVRIIGTAVFKGDKVIGSLDLYETQMMQLLTNQFSEAYLTIDDPYQAETIIAFQLKKGLPIQIKYFKETPPRFSVRLELEANLVSIQSGIDYSQPDKEAFLGRAIAKVLKNRIKKVIAKSQDQFQSDIFGFGARARNAMLTSKEWETYNWPAKYPTARIDLDIQVFIRRVGVQFQPPVQRN